MARCIRMLATGKVSEPMKFGLKLSRLAYTSWLFGMELVFVWATHMDKGKIWKLQQHR